MNFNRMIPELSVFDIERTKKFYRELGFKIEGLQKRGAYLREGIFLDVYLMGKLID